MRILIIDADNLLRDSLCALLRLYNDFQVIGALDSVESIGLIALETTPDIIFLDIANPESSGAGAITKVRHQWPDARVLVLTTQQNDRVLAESLRAGADAFVLKTDSRGELTDALHSIAKGLRYVSPAMHLKAYDHSTTDQQRSDGLTDRERDVMKRIAQGQRTREMALELSLSHKTIEKHRGSLMRKLRLKTATAVAAYAIANGYLDD